MKKTERNSLGRFAPGNTISRKGGQARAQALSPERRRQIGRLGFIALVQKRFEGDAQAAGQWLGMIGQAAVEMATYGDSVIYLPPLHPGSPEEFLSRWQERKAADRGLPPAPSWFARAHSDGRCGTAANGLEEMDLDFTLDQVAELAF